MGHSETLARLLHIFEREEAMVISNRLSGPFGRVRKIIILLSLILSVSVFLGLASVWCAMARTMTDPHACAKPLRTGDRQADTCPLPSTGSASMTAMGASRTLVFELATLGPGAKVSSTYRISLNQVYPDPNERPPQPA